MTLRGHGPTQVELDGTENLSKGFVAVTALAPSEKYKSLPVDDKCILDYVGESYNTYGAAAEHVAVFGILFVWHEMLLEDTVGIMVACALDALPLDVCFLRLYAGIS